MVSEITELVRFNDLSGKYGDDPTAYVRVGCILNHEHRCNNCQWLMSYKTCLFQVHIDKGYTCRTERVR